MDDPCPPLNPERNSKEPIYSLAPVSATVGGDHVQSTIAGLEVSTLISPL